MKRFSSHALLVAAITLAVFMTGSVANAWPRHIEYRGTSSQGLKVAILTKKALAGATRVQGWVFVLNLTCPAPLDPQRWIIGTFTFPGLPLDEHRRFSFDDNDIDSHMHLHGRAGWHHGHGHFRWLLAELLPDEQAVACSSGWVAWDATRRRGIASMPESGDVPARFGFARAVVRDGDLEFAEIRLPASAVRAGARVGRS